MEQLLSSLPVGTLGAGGLLTLVILFIIRGDLITRKNHEEIVALHKNAADVQSSRADKAEGLVNDYLKEIGTTVDKTLSSLPHMGPDPHEGKEPRDGSAHHA